MTDIIIQEVIRKSEKPDRVADNKSTMPYGDNVAAPAITEVDTTGYRQMKSKEASAKLRGRYEELQEEFRQLVATSEDTKRMYDAAVSFVPIIGHIYHLYRRENGEGVGQHDRPRGIWYLLSRIYWKLSSRDRFCLDPGVTAGNDRH